MVSMSVYIKAFTIFIIIQKNGIFNALTQFSLFWIIPCLVYIQ